MALATSKLSADEHGIILGQLCNALEPRLAVYLSSASRQQRTAGAADASVAAAAEDALSSMYNVKAV